MYLHVTNVTDDLFAMNSFVCCFHLAWTMPASGCAVLEKCANAQCRVVRSEGEGKLYRLDIDLGSADGPDERRIEYLWLCEHCAKSLHPMVEVADKTIRLRLVRRSAGIATQTLASSQPASPFLRPQ